MSRSQHLGHRHHVVASYVAPQRTHIALGLLSIAACACAGATAPNAAPNATTPHGSSEGVLEIPTAPPRVLASRTVVARGLRNPRGMEQVGETLLVSEAGTGDPASERSGALLALRDTDGDGAFFGAGERRVLLADQPSRNILDVVRRDEVFGMAGMAAGRDHGEPIVMVGLAFFGGPSTLFAVRGDTVTPWGRTHGNINDVAYDPKRDAWFGASSTTDEVVQLLPGNGSQRIVKLGTLASGQDAVPGYLRWDPQTTDMLVSLFSGSPEGEEGGDGTELVPRAGAIVRVDPESKRVQPLVVGLTVPTDLEVGPDGAIYVLEFCDAFLEPVGTREAMAKTSHGGFRRFSGRLLRIQRPSGAVAILAEGLDAPTNLAFGPGGLYVAQGMGTPGRTIPGPDGPLPLDGFIERIALQ
jgi:hypothetical protein